MHCSRSIDITTSTLYPFNINYIVWKIKFWIKISNFLFKNEAGQGSDLRCINYESKRRIVDLKWTISRLIHGDIECIIFVDSMLKFNFNSTSSLHVISILKSTPSFNVESTWITDVISTLNPRGVPARYLYLFTRFLLTFPFMHISMLR